MRWPYCAECPECKGYYKSETRWEYCPRCRARLVRSYAKQENTSTFTIAEVATMTGFSRQTVTRLFTGQRGVFVIEQPQKRNKRIYRSMRIPRQVYDRVIRGVTVK